MTESAFVRARRPEHKQQRREAILAAARDLATRFGLRNVSLGGVASEVGLAKSNVVRYFGTREEIYLELAAQEWQAWGRAVTERLGGIVGRDDLVDMLTESLAARPLFCDLLGNLSTSLEHNVSIQAAREFKRGLVRVLAELGARVARAYPELTEKEAGEVIAATTAFAGILYPFANPPLALAELYAEPDLAAVCPPFLPTLRRAVAAIIAGLPMLRP